MGKANRRPEEEIMTELYNFVTENIGNWIVFTLLVTGVAHILGVFVGSYMQCWSEKGTPPNTRDEHENNSI